MTGKSIVIIGTLDTKGEEIEFAKEIIESRDVDVHVVDTSVLGTSGFDPDTTATEVAEAGGESLKDLRANRERGTAMDVMGRGATEIVSQLHDDGVLDAVLGLGGSGNTSIATAAMRSLPVGVPKFMVSTVASGDIGPYVGATDITMMYSVADIEGLNQLSRRIISNAALATVGMVANEPNFETEEKPTIGITMFGVTTPCVQTAREYLENHGYETIVFHATGTGGRAMEDLVRQGVIDCVLDVTMTEWADEHVGGVFNAGPDRLDASGQVGIPHVVSVGALDMVNFGPPDSVPEKFDGRTFHHHNPQVTLMRTTPQENREIGEIIAGKLNESRGSVAVFLPLQGVSLIDTEGEDFYDPEADEALFDAIRDHLDSDVELVEMDIDINDEEFALAMAKQVEKFIEANSPSSDIAGGNSDV